MEEAEPLPLFKGNRMSPRRQTDARLVRRAVKGEDGAFAAIFERYGQELYRYCRAILGNPEDAQDAVQNTMARAIRALPGEHRSLALRPWLYRVARNESINLMRLREKTVELTEALSPPVPAADIRAEHREAVRTLVSDLASLPEAQRSALVLHEMSGLSHTEISEAMQRSPRASRQAIYEARVALQDLNEGRNMECDQVRLAVSDGDGRVLKGRKIRAHLRACQGCSDFALAIEQRHERFGLLAPPLPMTVAAGLISSAVGGGTAAGVGASAGVGVVALGAGGSAAFKSVGIVAASLALGIGGAKVAGVDLPVIGPEAERNPTGQQPNESEIGSSGASSSAAGEDAATSRPGSSARDRESDERAKGNGRGSQAGRGQANSKSEKPKDAKRPDDPASTGSQNAASSSAAGGASGLAPAGSGKPETPPGHSISDAHSSGQGGGPSASAGSASAVGGGPPTHSNAGGNSGSGGKPGK